jgi:cleavage and polyadenylation specificity factor subunit 1
LRTGEEIEEVENSEFYIDGPTVHVGTALQNTVIVQVYRKGIVVLTDQGKRIKDVSIGSKEDFVVSCSILDPYIALIMSKGEVMILKISDSKVPIVVDTVRYDSAIISACMYLDDHPVDQFPTNGELLSTFADPAVAAKQDVKDVEMMDDDLYSSKPADDVKSGVPAAKEYEDDDMDLYGESLPEESGFRVEDLRKTDTTGMDVNSKLERSKQIQYWLFLVDELGTLRIISLSDLKERFEAKDFHLCHKFLNDRMDHGDYDNEIFQTPVQEVVVLSLGADPHRACPYIVARNEKSDILIYRIIPNTERIGNTDKDRLGIQLTRIDHSYITRDPPLSDLEGEKVTTLTEQPKKSRRLIPFGKIGALSQQLYAGVMVTGSRPFWIMVAHTGGRECVNFVIEPGKEDHALKPAPLNSSNTVRVHPMIVDGGVECFTALHNVNIPYGFAYVNDKGHFRLAQLPPQFTYDHELPICKVMLGRSAHSLAYHMPSQTYILSTSSRAVFRIDQARYMAAVAAGVIANGDELPDSEKKVSGIQDVIEQRGIRF